MNIAPSMCLYLSDQTQFRLNKANEIKTILSQKFESEK